MIRQGISRHSKKQKATNCEGFGAIKLMVFGVDYTKGNHIDEARFDGDISKAKTIAKKAVHFVCQYGQLSRQKCKATEKQSNVCFSGSGLPKKMCV